MAIASMQVVTREIPIGGYYISNNNTNPATTLGYGTWSQVGQGRTLVGQDGSDPDFDVADEVGGAKTVNAVINHTHPVTDPGHGHTTQRYPTATGGNSGFTVDASMSGTLADNTLPVKNNTTGLTTQNPSGGVASMSIMNPYLVAYVWRRTV
mgnify:CR=1 FL=1